MTEHIILIGMPASGKTAVGQALADRLGLPFFDCDQAVSHLAGRSIPEIFAGEGEDAFRPLERRALEELCARAAPGIIATGGGAVERPDNCALLRGSGTVFWLDRDIENIMSTDYAAGRPLLAGGETALRELYARRRGLYEGCAHYRVPDGTVPQVADYILRIWRSGT